MRRQDCNHGLYSFNTYEQMLEKFSQFNEVHSLRWRKTQRQGRMVLDDATLPAFLITKRNLNWSSRGRKTKGVTLDYDGIPYLIVGREFYTCHQGPDVDKVQKVKRKHREEIREQQDPTFSIQRRSQMQMSKKKDCPATLEMLYTIKLPDFKIEYNTRWFRTQAAQKFHLDFDKIAEWNIVHQYHLQLPALRDHKNHPIVKTPELWLNDAEKSSQGNMGDSSIDPRSRLHEGTDSVSLSSEYPNDIHTNDWLISNNDLSKLLNEETDYEGANFRLLEEKCNRWISDKDNFLLREAQEMDGVRKPFLMVYQSQWQIRLLSLYGDELIFIDAVHRYHNITLPTYFVRIKTNVSHAIVGFFICENDRPASVQEGLAVLSSWNLKWRPKTVLVDYSMLNMNVTDPIFPDANVYLSDYQREKKWSEWLSEQFSEYTEAKNDIFRYIRSIARSTSTAGFEASKLLLLQSKWWSEHSILQNYYNNIWKDIENKWVAALRDESLNLLSISRVSSENENGWLSELNIPEQCRDSMAEYIDFVMNVVIPKSYRTYVELNIRSCEGYKNYRKAIPEFLRGRPKYLINHVLKRIQTLGDDTDFSQTADNRFEVLTHSGHQEIVYLGDNDTPPFCSCIDWSRTRLPCKHMLKILLQTPGYGWDSISVKFRESPFLKLDQDLFVSDQNDLNDELPDVADGDYIITILPKKEPADSLKNNVEAKWELILNGIQNLGDDKLQKLDHHFDDILTYIQGNAS